MDHIWRFNCHGGERTTVGPFTLEYQRIPDNSPYPFDPSPDGHWQARVIHRSGAVARITNFWTPREARTNLSFIARGIQRRLDAAPQPRPLSVAASIQADIEPRRMRELKELFAASD